MKKMLIGPALMLGTLCFIPPAAAQETTAVAASQATRERPRTATSWYGWQTLLVDGGVVGATLLTRSPWVFAGGHALGAPIVHWAHGNVGKGFASLGLRVLTPIALGFAYRGVDHVSTDGVRTGHENEAAMSFGLLAGGLTAALVDAAFLARTERTIATPAARLPVEPRLSASPRGAFAGIGGSF